MIVGAIIGGLVGFVLGRVHAITARRRFVSSLLDQRASDGEAYDLRCSAEGLGIHDVGGNP